MPDRDKIQLSKDLDIGQAVIGNLKYMDVFEGQHGPSPKIVLTDVEIVQNNETQSSYEEADIWISSGVGGKLVTSGAVKLTESSKGAYYKVSQVEVIIEKIKTDRGVSYLVTVDGEDVDEIGDLTITKPKKGSTKSTGSTRSGRTVTRGGGGTEAPVGDPKVAARRAKASMIAAHLLGKQLTEQGFAITEGQVTAFFIDFQRSGLDFTPLVKSQEKPPEQEAQDEADEPAAEEPPKKASRASTRKTSSRAKATREAAKVRDAIDKAAEDLETMPAAITEEQEEELPF